MCACASIAAAYRRAKERSRIRVELWVLQRNTSTTSECSESVASCMCLFVGDPFVGLLGLLWMAEFEVPFGDKPTTVMRPPLFVPQDYMMICFACLASLSLSLYVSIEQRSETLSKLFW